MQPTTIPAIQRLNRYVLILGTLFLSTMQITAGTILMSTAALDDSNFEHATIFIAAHNPKGAMGFVINKKFTRALNELEEFKQGITFPLYDGGPMDKEHLYFVHKRPDLIEGGTLISDSIYLGGNFKQAVAQLNNKTVTQKDIKIFIGYCGWDFKQLEEEVEEGSWKVADTNEESIFNTLR
ncbi:MAG: hypothetical protein RIS73_2385 [Bacteroidota bacterium]